MRIRGSQLTALAIALLVSDGISASVVPPARADDAKLDGTWKLVVLAFGDDEFAIVKLGPKDGKPAATVVDVQQTAAGSTASQTSGTERRCPDVHSERSGRRHDV